jgi:acetolactate synthase-1/2/3 large subunit
MKVNEYIAWILSEYPNIFTVSGAGNLHIINAIKKLNKSKLICPLHEQSCTIASYSNARYNKNLGVSIVTTGPGATNAITGVATAWLDSVPVLVISGQVPYKQTIHQKKLESGASLRTNGIQEINIVDIVSPITKFAITVNDAKKIRYYFEKAIYLAKNKRPGPVWLDIPQDIQTQEIGNPEDLLSFNEYDNNEIQHIDFDKIYELISSSKRPVIVWGYGVQVSQSESKMREFCDILKMPVLVTWKAIHDLEETYPYYIGRFGIFGQRASNLTIQNADLIINVGSRLGLNQIGYQENDFAREAKLITIDIDKNENIKYKKTPDLALTMSASEFLDKTLPFVRNQTIPDFSQWTDICKKWKEKYPLCLKEYIEEKDYVNSYYLVERLSHYLKEGDTFIPNASGTAYTCTHQTFKVKKNQKIITSNNLAEMGYDLPATIGVGVVDPSKQIVLITGDGSFQMNIQELQTIKNYNLKVKIFYLSNKGYLTIRNSQKSMFNGFLTASDETDGLRMPNIEPIALAYNFKYVKMNDNNSVDDVIEYVLNKDESVICEVMINPEQTCYPKTSLRMENGVAKQMPLEDLFPFLPRKEFKNEMIVKLHINSDYE